MTIVGVILSVLTLGLAILLARETKLRRALQALCSRLLTRLNELQRRHFTASPSHHRPRSRRR